MKKADRRFVHELAHEFHVLSESEDPEPQRNVVVGGVVSGARMLCGTPCQRPPRFSLPPPFFILALPEQDWAWRPVRPQTPFERGNSERSPRRALTLYRSL
jgi:hypothetical protein